MAKTPKKQDKGGSELSRALNILMNLEPSVFKASHPEADEISEEEKTPETRKELRLLLLKAIHPETQGPVFWTKEKTDKVNQEIEEMIDKIYDIIKNKPV